MSGSAEGVGPRYRLFHYYRSSSSWRVRWALRLKGVAYEAVAVDLLAGAQGSPEHRARNPLGMVPVLEVLPDGVWLGQSVAIIEYLDEVHPDPPLLPGDALGRARVRQLVEVINADTQPLQNLSVLRHASADPEGQRRWARHFIERGLSAYEALLREEDRFSHGDALSMADLFLLPQCHNARRFGLTVTAWPRIARIESLCLATPEAQETSPERLSAGGTSSR